MAVGNQKRTGRGKSRNAALRAVRGDGPRVSLYEEVTAKIISQLEAGIYPWAQPWNSAAALPGLPRNAISGRAYSGINVLILWGAVIDGGFASQDWLTFKQALAAGGCVRKGERGQTIFYADRFTPGDGHEQGNDATGAGEKRSIPFLKRFTVFNRAQCNGLPQRLSADLTPLPERELHDAAEALIKATGADFRTGGARAYYSPSDDHVQVPPQPAFPAQIDYYRTALHELGHNAVTGIMPHDLHWRFDFRALAMRRFGIIRALPGTRGGHRRAGIDLSAPAEQRPERAPFPSSAYRRGCISGWSRRTRVRARARLPFDRRRDEAGPSQCCGAAYAA